MVGPRWIYGVVLAAGLAGAACGDNSSKPTPSGNPPGTPPSDIDKVEKVLSARKEYQTALEELRRHYIKVGDVERARWAEDELVQFHRIIKQAYRLELDVPPPTLSGTYNIPEANELYRRAMTYKDKGWGGNDYVDNERRAELLLQQLLTNFPQSTRISDTAYQLGDIYEGKANKQPRRAAMYFERCFQWNNKTHFDARIRAARLYDKAQLDRGRAIELYKDVKLHEIDQKQIEEADKRLLELQGSK
jgi:tetratricopeptide (TPR) repeat protein